MLKYIVEDAKIPFLRNFFRLFMSKDSPFDLFGSGSKKPLKPSKKTPAPPPPKPESLPSEDHLPSNAAPPPPSDNRRRKVQLNPELTRMLERIFEMREDIRKQMEAIFEKTGLSQLEIENFLNNPRNYPPGKWEKIQNEKKMLEEKLDKALGITKKQKAQQQEAKTAKDRKGKLLGSRKNWIPMR